MIAKRATAMNQLGLGLNLSTKKTRKREFLEEMNRVVPWAALVAVVEPHAPRAKTGRPPFAIETMLRIHYLQQWFGLSDPAMEEALHDVPLYREFAGLGDGASRLPDESTILRFRHLLEAHDLAVDMLRVVNDLLQAKALLLRTGTAVDATLISAPSSTKNASGQRDPAMHQTKKGNQWYFGMKAHMAWMPTRAWCTPSGARRPTSTTWSRQRLAAWAGARCIRRRRLPGRAQAARGQGERDVARGAAPGSAQGAGQGAADGSAHR